MSEPVDINDDPTYNPKRTKHLANNIPHTDATHERWRATRISTGYQTRPPGPHQCGGCAFFLGVKGRLGYDWGVCSNPASAHDGMVVFEHDRCDAYAYSGWH